MSSSDHDSLGAAWRQRVQTVVDRAMPDLDVEQIEVNQDGLINDVAIVNKELVFRFAKNERHAKILENEVRILDLVRQRVEVPLPAPVHLETGCMVYPYLEGQPTLRETVMKLEEGARTEIAAELGAFLHALHTTPISEPYHEVLPTIAPATRERLVNMRDRVREKVYPLLLPHQVQWAEQLYASLLDDEQSIDYEPVLIHGDLAPYHILYNEESRRLAGVIDFGVAGIGDAAQDFGSLLSAYGESFVTQMGGAYANLEELLPRARSRAQVVELEWVLNGIETGETFWFTAHLGGARDMLA